ncbi:MAG: hypothetical protein Q9222_006427 [Ikaeria aurantiellina]
MEKSLITSLLMLAVWLPRSSVQVNIILEWHGYINFEENRRAFMEARCTSIPPGECCKPHPSALQPTGTFLSGYKLGVEGLLHSQFAAAWKIPPELLIPPEILEERLEESPSEALARIQCTGRPAARFHGPGDWHMEFMATTEEDIFSMAGKTIVAASWVDLRTRFPPDSQASRYLQWQNVRGLVWGSDTWNAASGGVPFPRYVRSKRSERLNQWAENGTAFIDAPARSRHPDVYTVNGTKYVGDGRSDGYRSAAGQLFNATDGRLYAL